MASTILPNANNTQIIGGQFSIVQNNSRVNQNGIDLLRERCAIGALLDSSERFDPPRCAEETREMLIEEILAWIYGGGESASMAWLFGGAGAGKSALAQTIAEILQRERRLAGSFFFSRTSTAERSDGNRLIPTLVFQLMDAFPALKPYIEDCIHGHGGLFDRAARTQMDVLFIEPLITLKRQILARASSTPSISPTPQPSSLTKASKFKPRRRDFLAKILQKNSNKFETSIEQPSPLPQPDPQPDPSATSTEMADLLRPRLIVIDGLDECSGQETQVEILRILARAIPSLPIPIRFLITSRPEGNITRTFDHDKSFQPLDIRRISLGDDENAANDIRRFLVRGFQEIHRTHPLRSLLSPSWPPQDAVDTLVQKSSSHFIYASTAMKYIQYSRGKPDNRLEVILGLSVPPTTDKPFAELDALYTHIFMSIEEPDRTTVNHVFGIVHVAGQSPSSAIATSPTMLEGYLGMQAGEINILLEPLFSLVVLSDNREVDIKVLHASLFDFLLDDSRSGGLHLDVEMAHGIIAKYWFDFVQTCTLDTLLAPPAIMTTFPGTSQSVLSSCWMFLNHGHNGCLLDDLREYLLSFPFLYDAILHPKFLKQFMKVSQADMPTYVLLLLQMFFTLLVDKGFDNGPHLYTVHTTKTEQQLQATHNGLGSHSCLLDDAANEPLFNNIIHQNVHCVYKVYLDVYLALNDMAALPDFLADAERWIGGETLRSHCLIVSLPYMTQENIILCTRYVLTEATGYTPSGDTELHQVLQQRIAEYLKRVEQDANPYELSKCKEAWGIAV